MLNKLALTLSIIFHPLLATTYVFLIIFTSDSFVAFLPQQYKVMLSLIVAINTILLPLLMLLIFKRIGLMKDFHLTNNRERVFPLAISILPYFFNIFLFTRLQTPLVLIKILQAGIYILLISALISYFWKISLHTTGMGGICGFLLSSAFQENQSALILLLICFIISGFLASARLLKGDHSPGQVYAGFLSGFAITFLVFNL